MAIQEIVAFPARHHAAIRNVAQGATDMDYRPIAVFAAILAAFCAGQAHAASFDCGKAKAPDELTVCRTPDLSSLDSEMGGLWYAFNAMPMAMGSSGARRDDAHQFLQDRGACAADAACLRKVYVARNQSLRGGIKNVLQNMQQEENTAEDEASAAQATPVDGLIAGYARQCTQLGGTPAAGMRPNLLTADFDGDGKTDYLLDTQPMQCDGAASAFCANNGCRIDIALSRQSYQSPTSVSGGQPTITLGEDGNSVAIWVDSTQCNLQSRDQACWNMLSWPGGKLTQRNQVRAAE